MIVRLADLTIDLEAHLVLREGEQLGVSGLSFDLLAYLLQQGQRVVSADELIESVWAPAEVNEETVTQRVKLLRQALDDDPRRPRYVRTVRGRGYQLCAPVSEQPEDQEVAQSTSAVGQALAVILIAALLLLGALWWPSAEQVVRSPDANHAEPANHAEIDLLLERARHYGGIGQRDDTLRAIELYRQALVLEPDSVDARLGLSFASSAMMCLHNDDSRRALEAEQLAEAVIAVVPDNAAAYAARAYAADCRGLIVQAMADYRRAVEIDPRGRLDSLASLAHLLAIRGQLADALAANLKARAGGHDLPLVDLQLAHNLELLGYSAAAETLLRRSFQLYPDSPFIAAAWPAFLFRLGRLGEAQAALSDAQQRPQHPTLWLLAGEMALAEGKTDAAVDAFDRALQLKPESGPAATLWRIYSGQLDPAWADARLNQLSVAIGAGDLWPDNWLEVALLEQARGEYGAALEALDQAREVGYRDRQSLALSPLWRKLREQPGFSAIQERIAQAIAQERERARQVPGLAELLGEGIQ